MISFITGKPGGGKGILSMKQIIDELVLGKRHIICNTPVRLTPWIFGGDKPMIGLQAYLRNTYSGKDYDCMNRVHILDDDDIASFFLWRFVDGKLVKADATTKTNKDGEITVVSYDTSLSAQSGGVMYVVDEAWKFYSSRCWQKTGEAMLFYSAQHRHFGDDVFIVTQHTKQIDPAVQRCAQDFWVVTNHSKKTMGFFRQPDIFSVAIYDSAPTGSQLTPMSRKLFRLDKRGICQTYDTSSGVGLSGRLAADVGSRSRGLPWWGIFIMFAIIILVLMYGLKGGGWLVGHELKATPAKVKPAVNRGIAAAQSNFAVGQPLPSGTAASLTAQTNQAVVVNCNGYVSTPKGFVVYLSDGRIAYSDEGDVQRIGKRTVKVFGESYRVVPNIPTVPADIQDMTHLDEPTYQSTKPVNDAQVTVIGQGYRDRQPPQKLGGFSTMQQSSRPSTATQY